MRLDFFLGAEAGFDFVFPDYAGVVVEFHNTSGLLEIKEMIVDAVFEI